MGAAVKTISVLQRSPLDRTDAFVVAVVAAAQGHASSACLLASLDGGCAACWCTCHPAPADGCDEGCGA